MLIVENLENTKKHKKISQTDITFVKPLMYFF